MTKTTTTYALPDEPPGPVWDKDGNKWERDGDYWKSGAYADREWYDLLHSRSPLTNTEPEPVWPTAPLVWHDGKVCVRAASETYFGDSNFWGKYLLNSETTAAREGARRFAREAISVTPVPTEAWETWKHATRYLDYMPDCELIAAVESLAQEVALVDATEALNGETNE